MKSDNLSKHIMLIAPVLFDYYKKMQEELELLGFSVDYVCDAPSNSNISKALGRINKKFILSATKKHFKNNVLSKSKEKSYDYILIIAGMTFSFNEDMIKQLKLSQSEAQFILYQWDAEDNLPNITAIHKYFDRIYTFDRIDCINKSFYNFLPLFYVREYREIAGTSDEKVYDCVYIGTAHPKKYKHINLISDSIKQIMPNQFIYHYMPSKLKFWYHKLFAPEFKKARLSDFNYNKLSYAETLEKIRQTDCVLDASQEGQKGLTIRTIECLGSKKKLITANEDVINYDFYDEQNILIFKDNIDYNSKFFNTPYKEIDSEIYEKYSLKNWLKTILQI